MEIFLNNISTIFIFYVIYSVIGWIWEVLWSSYQDGTYRNRGYLFGPYCPIYGVGALLILWVGNSLDWPWWANFFAFIVVCDIVEYLTSYFLEKIFHMRWWDYTYNKRFSINGRISLESSLAFGIGGILINYFIHPSVAFIVNLPSIPIRIAIAVIIGIIMMVDFVMSTTATYSLKGMLKGGRVDLTPEIKKFVRNYYRKATRQSRRFAKLAIKRMKKAQKKVTKELTEIDRNRKKAIAKGRRKHAKFVKKMDKKFKKKTKKNIKKNAPKSEKKQVKKVTKYNKKQAKKTTKDIKKQTKKISKEIKDDEDQGTNPLANQSL